METIKVLETFGIINLGRASNIIKICNKIPNILNNEIVLDIRECNIDYPATSKLVDEILIKLSKMEGVKKLKVLYDVHFSEIIILQYLIIGSELFGVSSKHANIDEYRINIKNKLFMYNIIFEVEIYDNNNSIIKKYKYGE